MGTTGKAVLSPQEWEEVRRLFDELLPLSAEERALRLKERLGERPELRAEVESLLAASEKDAQFLEQPITSSLARIAESRKAMEQGTPETGLAGLSGGNLRYVRTLGAGGMAEVFLARARGAGGFEKKMAVKRLLPFHSGDEDFVRLFENEARLSSLLNHPNIVHVYDFQSREGSYLLAMEYVEGKNLAQLLHKLKGQTLPLAVAVHLAGEILKGLSYAHELKNASTGESLRIVHRDVAPKNIMIGYDGSVKLVDFGIANAMDRVRMTQSGALRGTIQYMSPEQANGELIDARSDLFSVGSILIELITGRPLFTGEGALIQLRQVQGAEGVSLELSRLKAPEGLRTILKRALARTRVLRYPSAREFLDGLEAFQRESFPDGKAAQELAALMSREFAAEQAREASLDLAPGVEHPASLSAGALPVPPPPSLRRRALSILGLSFAFAVTVATVRYSFVKVFDVTPVAPVVQQRDLAELDEGDCAAHIASLPVGARVSLNGIEMGNTPIRVEANCDQAVELEIAHSGFEPLSQTVQIRRKNAHIVATLIPDSLPVQK